MRSGRPAACAISIASTMPFSGATRPTKQRASERRRSNGASSRREPVVDHRPRHVRMGRRLVRADGDQPGRRIDQGLRGPGQVEPAVERRHDRDRRDAREHQAGPFEVGMDQVELVRRGRGRCASWRACTAANRRCSRSGAAPRGPSPRGGRGHRNRRWRRSSPRGRAGRARRRARRRSVPSRHRRAAGPARTAVRPGRCEADGSCGCSSADDSPAGRDGPIGRHRAYGRRIRHPCCTPSPGRYQARITGRCGIHDGDATTSRGGTALTAPSGERRETTRSVRARAAPGQRGPAAARGAWPSGRGR